MALDNDIRGDEKKYRFWNTAPPDPIEQAHRGGMRYQAKVLHGVLMNQSLMPFGPYRGRIMTAVPAWYLLQAHAAPWGKNAKWHHVTDYTDRHLADITERAKTEEAKRQAAKPAPHPLDTCILGRRKLAMPLRPAVRHFVFQRKLLSQPGALPLPAVSSAAAGTPPDSPDTIPVVAAPASPPVSSPPPASSLHPPTASPHADNPHHKPVCFSPI